MSFGVSWVIFGKGKIGKTTLCDTTSPAPRLILDADRGSLYTSSKKMFWDPISYAPPEPSDAWDSAIVTVTSSKQIFKVYEYLESGQHPFKSVIVDSISAVQQRAAYGISGVNQMKTQDWGDLLRQVSDVVRRLRDMTMHPINPLDAVVFIAEAKERNDGTWYPYVQGGLATTLPYFPDVCAYLEVVKPEVGDKFRRLLIESDEHEVGERVGGRLGPYIDNPSITDMLRMIRGE